VLKAGPAGAGRDCLRGRVPGGACDDTSGAPGGSQTNKEVNSFMLELKQFRQQRWYPVS